MTEESKETQELFDQVVKKIKELVAIEMAAAEQKARDPQKTQQANVSNGQRIADEGESHE